MEIIPSNLDILFRDARVVWEDTVGYTPNWYQNISTTMTSGTRAEEYDWLDRVPQLEQWVGPKTISAIQAHTRRLLNVVYQQTIEISKWDIQDDRFQLFYKGVEMQAAAAKKWPDTVMANFIRFAASSNIVNSDGSQTSNLGFDQQPLYSTAHPTLGGAAGAVYSVTGASTQSNLYLNTALTWDNYVKVRTNMMSYLGADGLPLDVVPDVLMVPPALEGIGKLILEADYVPSTTSTTTGTAGQSPMQNTYKNSSKLFVNSQLADKPNNWWLLDTRFSVKPFVWQLRQAPQLIPMVNPSDWNVFTLAKFLWSVEARGAACESLWWLSAAATSAANY